MAKIKDINYLIKLLQYLNFVKIDSRFDYLTFKFIGINNINCDITITDGIFYKISMFYNNNKYKYDIIFFEEPDEIQKCCDLIESEFKAQLRYKKITALLTYEKYK